LKSSPYTSAELVDLLKQRQGGLTVPQYAAEIGISVSMLGNILGGFRSPGNEAVLKYLAPKGHHFKEEWVWILEKN
jgi:transcriptional regulator with XRE-family HTH domain